MTQKETTKLISGETFITSFGVRFHELLDENGKVIALRVSKLEPKPRKGDWNT